MLLSRQLSMRRGFADSSPGSPQDDDDDCVSPLLTEGRPKLNKKNGLDGLYKSFQDLAKYQKQKFLQSNNQELTSSSLHFEHVGGMLDEEEEAEDEFFETMCSGGLLKSNSTNTLNKRFSAPIRTRSQKRRAPRRINSASTPRTITTSGTRNQQWDHLPRRHHSDSINDKQQRKTKPSRTKSATIPRTTITSGSKTMTQQSDHVPRRHHSDCINDKQQRKTKPSRTKSATIPRTTTTTTSESRTMTQQSDHLPRRQHSDSINDKQRQKTKPSRTKSATIPRTTTTSSESRTMSSQSDHLPRRHHSDCINDKQQLNAKPSRAKSSNLHDMGRRTSNNLIATNTDVAAFTKAMDIEKEKLCSDERRAPKRTKSRNYQSPPANEELKAKDSKKELLGDRINSFVITQRRNSCGSAISEISCEVVEDALESVDESFIKELLKDGNIINEVIQSLDEAEENNKAAPPTNKTNQLSLASCLGQMSSSEALEDHDVMEHENNMSGSCRFNTEDMEKLDKVLNLATVSESASESDNDDDENEKEAVEEEDVQDALTKLNSMFGI